MALLCLPLRSPSLCIDVRVHLSSLEAVDNILPTYLLTYSVLSLSTCLLKLTMGSLGCIKGINNKVLLSRVKSECQRFRFGKRKRKPLARPNSYAQFSITHSTGCQPQRTISIIGIGTHRTDIGSDCSYTQQLYAVHRDYTSYTYNMWRREVFDLYGKFYLYIWYGVSIVLYWNLFTTDLFTTDEAL